MIKKKKTYDTLIEKFLQHARENEDFATEHLIEMAMAGEINSKPIPIVGTVKCGPDGIAFEDLDGPCFFVDKSIDAKNVFALMCRGNSMLPVISEGDIVVVRRQEDPKDFNNGDLVVVIIGLEEGALKKFFRNENEVRLVSSNPIYPTRYFQGEEINSIKIIGKVIDIHLRK
jgi:repressor LexA